MFNKDRRNDLILRVEIAVAAVLFFIMLICCGLYIDIRMNGRTSNLPTLSETDTRLLLSTSEFQTDEFFDDLLEPVFVGVRNNDEMLAVPYDNDQRRLLQDTLCESLNILFKGKSEFVYCDEEHKSANVEDVKNIGQYILVSFYDDLPSDVILPCISQRVGFTSDAQSFFFKHLFVVPDEEGNVSAIAVSSGNDIVKLLPYEKVKFNNFFDETYDIIDGGIPFVYYKEGSVSPVLSSSIECSRYEVLPYAEKYGISTDAEWLKSVFNAFSFNPNLIKSFTTGDGSEVNFVEEFRELIVNIDGSVEYKNPDGEGEGIDEFIGYLSVDSQDFTFSDVVFALKNLINTLYKGTGRVSCSLAGIDYIEDSDSLKIYFKYTTDGIFIFEDDFDAVFEIKNNKIVYAKMLLFNCSRLDSVSTVLPQKYASSVSQQKGNSEVFPVLGDEDDDGIRELGWASLTDVPEVIG